MINKNKDKAPEKRRISWGKYTGWKFGAVPTEYLMWFVRNSYSQMRDRRKWAKEELSRRGVIISKEIC